MNIPTTEAELSAFIRDLAAEQGISELEATKQLRAEVEAIVGPTAPPVSPRSPAEPWAKFYEPPNASDAAITLDLLAAENGGDRAKAAEAMALGLAGVPEAKIAAERRKLEARAVEQAKADYSASPEGLRAEAAAVSQAAAERAERAADARALIDSDPERFGITAANLTDEEAVAAAGFNQRVDADADTYEANLAHINATRGGNYTDSDQYRQEMTRQLARVEARPLHATTEGGSDQ